MLDMHIRDKVKIMKDEKDIWVVERSLIMAKIEAS
jgi:hypothetical protein